MTEWIIVGVNGLRVRLRAEDVEIMQLLCRGRTYCEIGASVGLSGRTIYTHVQDVRNALGVDTRIEALLLLVQAGVLDVDGSMT